MSTFSIYFRRSLSGLFHSMCLSRRCLDAVHSISSQYDHIVSFFLSLFLLLSFSLFCFCLYVGTLCFSGSVSISLLPLLLFSLWLSLLPSLPVFSYLSQVSSISTAMERPKLWCCPIRNWAAPHRANPRTLLSKECSSWLEVRRERGGRERGGREREEERGEEGEGGRDREAVSKREKEERKRSKAKEKERGLEKR
jgi:hypothetical protein